MSQRFGQVFEQIGDFVNSVPSNLDRYFEQVGKVFEQIGDFVNSVLSNFSAPSDICSEILSILMIFAIVILAILITVVLFLIFVNAHLKKIDNSLREINEFLKFQK